jgi:exodeoxyribonuclease VII large subunit
VTADFFEFRREMNAPRRPAPPAPQAGEKSLTVFELTNKIRQLLTAGLPRNVFVRGEVSNLRTHQSSGHAYFTLRDDWSCLGCVMFRSEVVKLKFELADGLELLAGGRIEVYGPKGSYQLNVSSLRPLGQGALELAFRQVRAKLEAEGLFAPERKKPLPAYARRIVIITSREAAALQDVLKVLRRFMWLHVMLYPVPVQGDGAAQRLADAIAHVNRATGRVGGAEVILLCRGGGSLEDLWPFNEEVVARAIAASRIPIITGIGHEVDVSIADLVADYHAHTPTEAAQVITARWRVAAELTTGLSRRLDRSIRVNVGAARQRLEMLGRHETFRRPMDRVNALRQRLDERGRTMIVAQEGILREAGERVTQAHSRLDALVDRRLRTAHERLRRVQSLLQECHPRPRFELALQRLNTTEQRLSRASAHVLQLRSAKLEAAARQLEAVSPQAVLRRGYTITFRKGGRVPLRSSADLKPGDKLLTRFADGEVQSIVDDSRQLSLFD